MVSLFLRSSGVTAKIGWCNKVYHDNTEHNYVLAFVLKKKNGGKIPGNFRGGNAKAR